MIEDLHEELKRNGLVDRVRFVLHSGEVRGWIANKAIKQEQMGWRDIMRVAVLVYERKFSIHYEYKFYRKDGTIAVDIPELTVFTEEAAQRQLSQLNQSRHGDEKLFIYRRLVGKFERVDD